MGELPIKYAILIRRTKLHLSISSKLLQRDVYIENDSIVANEGTLLKIFDSNNTVTNSNQQFYQVQIMDYNEKHAIYENLYLCPLNNLCKINEDVWPYIISIKSRKRRFTFVQSKKMQWATYIKVNDFVSVNGDAFGIKKLRYDCIVRYIGPVPEIHPVGYFFGLELLHLENGESPQKDDIPFTIKYLSSSPALSIFVTADWILPISIDVKKKFSAFNIIGETFDKVCSAINNNLNATSSEMEKKPIEKQSKFYVQSTISDTSENMPIFLFQNEKRVPETSYHLSNKDDTLTESDNYERCLEKHIKGNCGILKNSQKIKDKSPGITSLEGRDIIVIDTADIQELTKNESNIIVVEKPDQNGVDLADLLGTNWPNVAGDAAFILNSQKENRFNNTNSCYLAKNRSEKSKIIQFNKNDMSQSSELHSDNMNKPKLNNKDINEKNNILTNDDAVPSSPMQEVPGTILGLGSVVEVSFSNNSEKVYGVIRWIGMPPGVNDVMLGIELEESVENATIMTTNGTFNGYHLFDCQENRAVFVLPEHCAQDRRFIDHDGHSVEKQLRRKQSDLESFGMVECPLVPGSVAPLKIFNLDDLEEICGKFKGIQGHHNSCYLDATLFAMFTFTSVFDSLLYRLPDANDISNYIEVQSVLREEIVNPLRKKLFVRADRVMKLRKLLDKLSSISGLTSEEKDPEEFLNSLLAQIMRVEPFLKLNSGQDSYFYQLFVEKDELLTFPSVQQLFEQSFHSSNIKLKEVPSCMIIQMPRFGKSFKMYQRILPSQVLDVTDIIEDSPRQCTVCGKVAEFECRDCFGNLQGGIGLEGTSFCPKCLETVHMHTKRANHKPNALSVPQDFRIMAEHMTAPRLYMELFAVVCIETSHYVSFVKAGSGPDAPWCFFDSMADRKGEQNGYNIPEILSVPDLPRWLSDDGAKTLNESSMNDKLLPELAKRLFCDAYMCMYQSTDVMMYR